MAQNIKKTTQGGLNTSMDWTGQPPFPPDDYVVGINTRFAGRGDTKLLRRVTVKGNILVSNPYLPTTGTNRTVGVFEFIKDYVVIVMNWNSEGNHGIYKYYRTTNIWVKLGESSYFDFLRYNKISQVHLQNNELLYWTNAKELKDGTLSGGTPKKFNIAKADNLNKKRTYNLYFDSNFITEGNVYTVNFFITNSDGTTIETAVVPYTVGGGTIKEEFNILTGLLNDGVSNATFTSMGNYIALTLNFAGAGNIIAFMTRYIPIAPFLFPAPILAVAQNGYDLVTFPKSYVERAKMPPVVEPKCQYGYDPDFGKNLLQKKYFQFCIQYVYDDGEWSVASPYSEMVYATYPCGVDETDSVLNYITIDFKEPNLNDRAMLSILKRVRLFVREGDIGQWKFIKELERQDFGITTNTFRFYNDGNYNVAPADLLRIEDKVPLKALAQNFVHNVGYMGGLEEGFSAVPIDGKVELSYIDDECVKPNNGKVNVTIFIRNQLATWAPGQSYQPIHNYNEGPCFGGMTGPLDLFASTVIDKYKQQLPLRGFLCYLVGTDYYGISVQNPAAGVSIDAGEGNVYLSDTNDQRNAIRDAMAAGQVFSTCEISAPPGDYILRVASHFCSADGPGPYKFPGDNYQNTSTYVKAFSGSSNIFEIPVTITADGTFLCTLEINDLVAIDNIYESSVINGYMIDADGISEQDILNASPRMELAKIQTNQTGVQVKSYGSGGSSGIGDFGYTDHNGFFYFAKRGVVGSSPNWKLSTYGVNGVLVKNETTSFYTGDLNELVNETLDGAGDEISVGNYAKPLILYSTNELTGIKTKIQGIVQNNGVPVPGIMIVCEKTNRIAFSDGSGAFSILVYGNAASNNRTGNLIIIHDEGCCTEYPDGQQYIFNIIPFIEDNVYSLEFPFDIGILNVLIDGTENELRWKKRNLVQLFVEYSDDNAGRVTRALPLGDVYIPFVTEQEGNTGKPIINWSLNNQPPIRATKYRLGRKLNPFYDSSRILQFIIGEVKYVKYYDTTVDVPVPVVTDFDSGDATEIYISMLTTVMYKQTNSGAVIGFLPVTGDRITLMRDELGTYFEDFYDIAIENVKGLQDSGTDPMNIIIKASALLPEIKEGMLIEVYSPKARLNQEEVFEFSETFEILEPGTDNRRHGAGINGQEQILGFQPATGEIEKGDIYYRNRKMVMINAGTITNFIYKIEDPYIYDTDIKSNVQSIGRPNYEDVDYKQQFFPTRIRYDFGFLATGGKVYNGHSNFGINDFIDLDVSYNSIVALMQVGEAAELLSIHRNKVQPLYLKRSPIWSIDGQQSVATTETPITLGVQFEQDWGTQNAESIIPDGNAISAVDLFSGVIWTYAQGPLIPISIKYNIDSTIINIREQLLQHDLDKVFINGAVDRLNNELVWAFEGVTAVNPPQGGDDDDPDEDTDGTGGIDARVGNIDLPADFLPVTISFNFERNKWEGFYTYYPEMLTPLGRKDFYTFKDGQMWRHDANEDCFNWYGVKDYAQIGIVINEFNDNVKDYMYIRITGNKAWKALITILPTETYPKGMKSRITENLFVHKEGVWWAEFLRDETDPTFNNPLLARFNGRILKGNEMLIILETKQEKQVHFSQVDVGVILSPESL